MGFLVACREGLRAACAYQPGKKTTGAPCYDSRQYRRINAAGRGRGPAGFAALAVTELTADVIGRAWEAIVKTGGCFPTDFGRQIERTWNSGKAAKTPKK